MSPRSLAALAAMLLPAIASAAPREAFTGWPRSWAESYRKFEKFLQAQTQNMPASDVEITSDGRVETGFQFDGTGDRAPRADVFTYSGDGNGEPFEMTGQPPLTRPVGKASSMPVAAGVKICGLLGYQYLHPLSWFEAHAVKTGPRPGDEQWEFRRVRQPEPAEDFWPNDRQLSFLDFQTVFGQNPLDYLIENKKVSPNVSLAVTASGTVERNLLAPDFEKLLRWRIYHNGRLIERGSAAGDAKHLVARGVGAYVVLVGVEGPNGFMSVSNFLQFPLFPEKDGRFAVLPTVSNKQGFPDFLLDILSPEEKDAIDGNASWAGSDGYYNKLTVYGIDSRAELKNSENQALFSLWTSWSWSIWMAKDSPNSEINRINMVKAAK